MQTFTLRTNFDEFVDDAIDAALFERILDGFQPDVWDFMVLSPGRPIKDSAFLQVGAPDAATAYRYTMEMLFHSGQGGRKMYRNYTADADEVLQALIGYREREAVPDIALWEDITHEMPG